MATLKKFGFGSNFIQWIKVLLSKTQSCVTNNGFTTGYFDITPGTKQGDHISPYIFILVIEILAHLVRENQNIEGVQVLNGQVKSVFFADDSTFF